MVTGLVIFALWALALLVLWLGFWALHAAVGSFRLLATFRRAHTGGFDQLLSGPVALRGMVVPIDTINSPETGRSGVYLAYAADRWEVAGTIGISGQWMRAEQDAEAAPFELTDGITSILIDPLGAAVSVPRTTTIISPPGSNPIRFHEAVIEEGQDLFVIGNISTCGGFTSTCAYRGHTLRPVVTRSGPRDLTLIDPRGFWARLLLQGTIQALGALPAIYMLVVLLTSR